MAKDHSYTGPDEVDGLCILCQQAHHPINPASVRWEGEVELIGYDRYGAPLYEHQLPAEGIE